MTVPLRVCSDCKAAIPGGALYCLSCGAASPTEGVKPLFAAVEVTERTSAAGLDLQARRTEIQGAIGAGFEIKSLIGRGGFGEVWSAVDAQLGRDVAVKVLRPEIGANPDFRKRFRREARAIARLRHPGIVPIYHVGDSGGMVWFIMPLVDGITLRAALGEPGGVRVDEAVRVLIEVAGALKDAHAHGIVHRDIKPENIMLEGPQRRVLLMDFGVAKVEDPGGGDRVTEADVVFGSPEYMSPEQATARELDARSDIYSLGVVGYRMLAGRLPFDAETPREVLAHHVLTPPPPLPAMASVPAAVAEAVMRCLAKTPDARWQSVEAFARALSAAAPRASRIATAPSASGQVTVRAPVLARRRWALPLVLVLIAGLGVAALWPLARWRRQRQWASAASAIAAQYRRGADSLVALAGAFTRGTLTAAQFALAREDLLTSTDAAIEEKFGAAVDDSANWGETSRRSVREAAARITSAGAAVENYTLHVSDVPGCRLTSSGDTVRLADEAPGDNCWFAAEGVVGLAAPVEYAARFRIVESLRSDAGLGLAWCRSDGECRITFLWSSAPTVWGANRPHRGLVALALGARAALTPGDHELRVRWQDGVLWCRLDGRLILRRTTADASYLEHPGSLDLVVQNARVDVVGPNALGAVGARRAASSR